MTKFMASHRSLGGLVTSASNARRRRISCATWHLRRGRAFGCVCMGTNCKPLADEDA